MPVNLSATLKGDRSQLTIDRIDSKVPAVSTGAGSAGSLVIGTSALAGATGVLATIPLQVPSFTRSGFVDTLAGVPIEANATASGTAALAEFRNNAGTVVISGLTVGTVGTDVIIDDPAIFTGKAVRVSSATITHG